MTITQYRCDCCNKEKNKSDLAQVKMPICKHKDRGFALVLHDMDFCNECATKFTQLYYQIAQENNYSGIKCVGVSE